MKLMLNRFYGLILLGWLIINPFNLIAQDIEQYKGEYIISDSLVGEAAFDFYKEGRDTVKHGQFKFETKEYTPLQGNLFTGMEFSGNYNQSIKDGSWKYRFLRYNLGSNPRIDGNEVVFQGNGNEYIISARFRKGKPHGKWQTMERTIENGEPIDTLFLTKATYEDGMMTGSVEAFDDNTNLHGHINDEGLVNGKWVLKENKNGIRLKEQRIYDEGILKDHFFIKNEDTLTINHTGLDTTRDVKETTWEKIPAGELYFQVLNITYSRVLDSLTSRQIADSTGFITTQNNKFIKQALTAFHKHNDQTIWSMTEGSDSVQPPEVKIRKFPFSEKEENKLQNITKRFKKAKALLTDYFEDAQVDISRHAYEDVKYYYEIMKLYQGRLEKLEEVIYLISSPAFEYIDRRAVMDYIIPEITYPDTIAFDFDNKKYKRLPSFPENLEKGENLDAVHNHLVQVYENVKKTTNEVDRILKEYRKEKRLAGREEELINVRDSVIALFNNDNKYPRYNKYHKRVGKSVLSFYEKAFKDYATLTLEKKISKVEELIDCYKEGLSLYDALAKIPQNLENLDQQYTKTTWNPHTFTNMDERIKKKLYKAYRKRIFPFLIKDLQEGLACGNIESKANNFDKLFSRMAELRNQNTEFIENELRRAQTSKEIISVFDLDLNLNQ